MKCTKSTALLRKKEWSRKKLLKLIQKMMDELDAEGMLEHDTLAQVNKALEYGKEK